MTYKDAVSMWRTQFYAPLVEKYGDKDIPRIRLEWNMYTEWLRRDGDITEWQWLNWKQPPECKPDA